MMMIGSAAARWLLTAAFAVALVTALRPARRRADPAAAAFCVTMCAALICMTWIAESAAAGVTQAVGFGLAGLWFALAGRSWPDRVYHVLMAAAMIWMLTVATSGSWRFLGGLVSAVCIGAALPWLVRAVGPRFRLADPGAAGNAVMSAGMAAMVLAML